MLPSTSRRAAALAAALCLSTAAFAQGSDECASAHVFTGSSTFVANGNMTTGSYGQGGPCGTIERDVWFSWVASQTGLATLSTCSFAQFDTKIRVYAGTTCPPSAAIACSDDVCGTSASADFYAVAGQSYLFQIGSKPGTSPGAATLSIAVASPDQCANPIEITGRGTFPFDNSYATTGPEAQTLSSCDPLGQLGIAHDVWYRWTAPSNGTATISTCNQTDVDTKLAVHQGWCQGLTTLACNDDDCGLQSRVTFACQGGSQYLIQLGTYAPHAGGSGTFKIEVAGADCAWDQGYATGSIGRQAGGSSCWLQTFGIAGATSVLSSVSVVYGLEWSPGNAPPNGTPATIAVWDDVNDDGVPYDAVLVRTVATTIQNVDTLIFNTVQLDPPVVVGGRYFVGVVVAHGPGLRPAATDNSNAGVHRAWFAGNASGSFFLENLMVNSDPPVDAGYGSSTSFSFLLRVGCDRAAGGYGYCQSGSPGYSCAALGLGCADGIAGHGCANSANPAGALLAATGSPNVLGDTVRLLGSGLPPSSSALIFQSTTAGAGPAPFGDGLRCAGGTVVRIATRVASALGTVSYGKGIPGDVPVHTRGQVYAPGWRYYQLWYRNSAAFCTSATFNLSNGFALEWQ